MIMVDYKNKKPAKEAVLLPAIKNGAYLGLVAGLVLSLILIIGAQYGKSVI